MVNTRGGGDSPFLLQRTLDMAENLRHGIFPARWMMHAAYDLGYPFFNHYAALPYYLSGGLTALGVSPLVAIQATQTFGFVLAALTMALWAEYTFKSRTAAFVAAAAYTFAPFHLVNVYVRGDSLSEFYAFVWYPLILRTLDRIAERPTRGRIIAASLAYGALILTHNTSALVFSPFALLYAIFRVASGEWRVASGESANQQISKSANLPLRFMLVTIQPTCNATVTLSGVERASARLEQSEGSLCCASRDSSLRSTRFTRSATFGMTTEQLITFYALRLVAPFLLAFLFTAWFWLPAIGETKYGQMGPEFTAGYFHYSNHFRGLDLVQRTFAFDYSVSPHAEDAGPFAMGLAQAVLAVVGVVGLMSKVESRKSKVEAANQQISESANQRMSESANGESPLPTPHSPPVYRLPSTVYLLFALALATFMITPLSKPLWDHLPLLEITQFPWRFLSIQAVFTAMVTGAIVNSKIVKSANLQIVMTVVLCGLVILAALLGLHPERLLITDADVTAERLLFYETFTGNIGTTIRYEYLPRDVSPRLYISEAAVDGELRPMADGGGLLAWNLLQRTPARQVWQITIDAGGATVAFPLNWWPGWQADVDGARVDASPMTGSGRLAVSLPAGEHTVALRLRNTPLRSLAEVLSILTIMALIAWAIFSRKPKLQITNYELRITNPPPSTVARVCAPCLLSTLIISIALPALLHHASFAPATFFDFNQMPYPHAGPVDFGAAYLGQVTLSTPTVQPGDALTAQFFWTDVRAGPLTGTLRLVSPAEPRHGVPYALAETMLTLPCEVACAATLIMPDDLSRGLYLLELRLYGVNGELRPRSADGSGLGTLYVGAVRVPHGPARRMDAPVLAEFRDITLHAIEPIQSAPTALRLKMTWSTPGTPRNWSLSLRLLDAAGRQLVQQDIQPGYGYLPTTLWLPGETVTDYPVLTLPEGLAPGDYTLRIITYLLATMEGGGQADIPLRLTATTLYDLRNACCEQTRKGATILCQTGGIALLGADLPEQLTEGRSLDFHAEWNAVAAPTADLTARWEVLDASGNIVGDTEGPLAVGSRTSEWPWHTWVRAPVHVDLPPVLSPGVYDVRLTLAEPSTSSSRVTVCTFRERLTVTPRPRVFAAPAISHPLAADFGGEIRLLGYDLQRKADVVTLVLWWQAATAPARDYKRFVHLYDPATENIVAQDDAMPRAWAYPTTWWATGEVVSETVTLDVNAVPPGEYRLGVGWYDPATLDRLPATDAAGQPHPLNRVTLDMPLKR